MTAVARIRAALLIPVLGPWQMLRVLAWRGATAIARRHSEARQAVFERAAKTLHDASEYLKDAGRQEGKNGWDATCCLLEARSRLNQMGACRCAVCRFVARKENQ